MNCDFLIFCFNFFKIYCPLGAFLVNFLFNYGPFPVHFLSISSPIPDQSYHVFLVLFYVFFCSFLSFYVSSCLILSYPVLSCPILSYPVEYCRILSNSVLSYSILSCPILSCRVLSYPILSYHVYPIHTLRRTHSTDNYISAVLQLHVPHPDAGVGGSVNYNLDR